MYEASKVAVDFTLLAIKNTVDDYYKNNPKEYTSDTVSANYDLADLNFALQARTEDGLNKYVDGHTNRALAEKHLQDGGFANFLEQLDMAVS